MKEILQNQKPESRFLRRIFEIIPGFLSWFTIIAIFPLSHFVPVFVALFVILYDLSWLIKVIHISAHLVYSYQQTRITWKTNYTVLLENISHPAKRQKEIADQIAQQKANASDNSLLHVRREVHKLERELKEISERLTLGNVPNWEDIYHVVLFPTVKESFEVLDSSLAALARSDYPLEKIIVVMAFEDRAGEHGRKNAELVQQKYGPVFHAVYSYFHPSNIPGEMKAKSSNMTYAMHQFEAVVALKNIPHENIIVSAFDADTQVAREYIGCLTYHYVKNSDRTRSSYQPIPVYHNNIWDVPAMARVSALGSTFWQMIEASRPQRLITFSSHATSYVALKEVDYWPVDVISEDSQIFWRCYLHYNGKYRVEPMFTTVSMDATDAETYFKALVAQYNQKKRWFWGIENFPYICMGFIENKKISLRDKISQSFRMVDSFYTLATAPIILALGGWLPNVLGGQDFLNSVVSQNLILLTSLLTTLALVGLLTTFIISMSIIPTRPTHRPRHMSIIMILQWVLVPIVTVIFGSIPAIDSQTRLMLGKRLGEFWVAEKTRKVPKSA